MVQDKLGIFKVAVWEREQVQRLALLEEIKLVLTAAHAVKLYGSTHNLLKGEHRSASILVSYPHGVEGCRQCEPL